MKRNLQKYSQILENLHEGIWIIDEDANTILVNSRMAEMLGYTVDEMLGKPIFSFLDEYDTVIATRALERRKQGIREQLEHQLLCRDGTLIHTLFEASPMYDDEGNYAGSIAGVVDITERKQLEKALRESEERYQELADFLPQTVFEFDERGNFTFANRHGFQTFGYTLEDFDKGLNALQMLVPEDRDRAKENIQRALSGEELGGNEYTALSKDGSTFPVIIYSAPIIYENKPVGLRGFVIDITERKQAEERIKQAAEEWQTTFDSIADLVLIQDRDFRIVKVNRAFADFFKREPEELIGKACYQTVHGTNEPWPGCPHKQTLETNTPTTSEFYEPYLGTHIQVSTSPVFDEKGEVSGCVHIVKDITERKRAEEALRESERHYRLLAENAKDAIWTVDMNMRPTYMSPSITYLLGYTVEEAMAKPMEAVYTPASFEIAMKVLAKELALENMEQKDLSRSRTVELELNRKDGSIVPVEGNFSFIRGPDGRPVGILAIARDITERKRAEEALRESERHYRLLADNVTDIIFTVDMNLRYTYVSPSVTRLSGYSVEEATSHTLQEVLTPASFEVAMKAFAEEKILEHMEESDPTRSRTLELELNRKDGSTFWTEVQLTTLRDHDGHPIGFVGVARDISKLRKGQ